MQDVLGTTPAMLAMAPHAPFSSTFLRTLGLAGKSAEADFRTSLVHPEVPAAASVVPFAREGCEVPRVPYSEVC